jgi:hypothetical protein
MKCPGQDSRYWKQSAIFDAKCPECGALVEFFKDDTTRRCRRCGHKFLNPRMDFGCASYCKYAEQCIGSLSPELLAQKEDLLKDRVAIEMKRFFRQDFRNIGHATRTARYAEEIGRGEGGNLAVILTAAYLHNVGWDHSFRTGGPAASGQPAEAGKPDGAREARDILEKLEARKELVGEVMAVIERVRRGAADGDAASGAVHDACTIATLEEERKAGSSAPGDRTSGLAGALFTETGRKLAERILSG